MYELKWRNVHTYNLETSDHLTSLSKKIPLPTAVHLQKGLGRMWMGHVIVWKCGGKMSYSQPLGQKSLFT
jgi:hypothetical protein